MTDTTPADPRVRVGIVGLPPGRSWSARTHVPALRALPAYDVVGVANSSAESSHAATEALDIPHAFADARQLAGDPDLDLVAVPVKVPRHRKPVDAALGAHKMAYCEWPLGTDLADAEAMAKHARDVGVRTAVGLQARSAPTMRYVRDLIRGGQCAPGSHVTHMGHPAATDTIADGRAAEFDRCPLGGQAAVTGRLGRDSLRRCALLGVGSCQI